jgi:hypothetical protein
MKFYRYSLGSGNFSRLSSLLVVALLSAIAVMLIAPAIDPPDIAYPANAAPAVIHGTIHHVPHRNQQSHAFEVLPGTSENSEDFCGRHSETTEQIPPLASQQILRC